MAAFEKAKKDEEERKEIDETLKKEKILEATEKRERNKILLGRKSAISKGIGLQLVPPPITEIEVT